MAVDLRCDTPLGRAYCPALRAAAKRLLATLSCEGGELSLLLADDRAIRKLNRDYRGKDAATDVLSFPSLDDGIDRKPLIEGRRANAASSPPLLLGDVVISVETALRQARALGVPPAARLRTLLIHGLLHLLGYDHERSPAEARRMFARERELAARLEAQWSGQREAARTVATRATDPDWSPAAMPPGANAGALGHTPRKRGIAASSRERRHSR